MTSAVGTTTEIRPFHVDIPDGDLAELRRRIAATREPELFSSEVRAAFKPLRT